MTRRTVIDPPAYDPARPTLHATAQVATALPGAGATANGGRWLAYDGGRLPLEVWGLAMEVDPVTGDEYPTPIHVVADLDTLRPRRDSVPGYVDHCEQLIAGRWERITIDQQGVAADAVLYVAATEAEERALDEATRIKALIDRDHPIELSIGMTCDPGGIEEVPVGAAVDVNGRTFSRAADGRRLFVWRGAELHEISYVTRGACAHTRRLAASLRAQHRPHPATKPALKDPPMKLTAHAFARTMILLAGQKLGSLVSTGIEDAVAARLQEAGDDADEQAIRGELMSQLSSATGIEPATINQIASGEIDEPAEEVRSGLAEVLPITREQIDEAVAADTPAGDTTEGEAEHTDDHEGDANTDTEVDDDDVAMTAKALAADSRVKGHEAEAFRMLAKGLKPHQVIAKIQDRRIATLEAKLAAGGKPGDDAGDGPRHAAATAGQVNPNDLTGTDDELRERYRASASLQETFSFGVESFVAFAKAERRKQRKR